MNTSLEHIALGQHQVKSYDEVPSSEGFISYGNDNLFPQYLLDLYQSSPTHTALITSIAQMVYGEGFIPVDLESKLAFQSWNMNDELRKCCFDFKIQGGFALEVQWSLDRSTIANVSHLPFENIRACEVGDDDKVKVYKYSTDWADTKVEIRTIHTFSSEYAKEFPSQIMYVKPFSPGSFYYPKPDYIGAIHYCEVEKNIGLYHINNIQNGLSPSFSIHFKNGIPPVEERNQIRNDIESQMTGAKGAGKVWITYSDLPEQKPDFEPIPLSDADKQYQFLSEEATSKIMIGHRVTNPMMFGVLVPGKLGGGDELVESNLLFLKHVIEPMRKVINEAIITLLAAAGLSTEVNVGGEEVAEANVSQSYTGIQISSALDVITRVGTGELTKDQAVQILVSMLGFGLQQAETMFEGIIAGSIALPNEQLAEQLNLDGAIDYLEGVGEDIDDDWELIDARPYDEDTEAAQDALWAFATARVPSSNPNGKSKQDGEFIKVRYRYAPDSNTHDPQRSFCKKMMSAGKVYRIEDIMAASDRVVNPGFGPRGTNRYDILFYKGGPNCYHWWERRTYLKKNNKNITVNKARKIITSLPVNERAANRLPKNVRKVAQRPIDMPNHGYLPK